MRSKEALVDDFNSLTMGIYDRMARLTTIAPELASSADANAAAVVDSLTSVQKRYGKIIDKLDAALGRASRARSNVVTFRRPVRRKP